MGGRKWGQREEEDGEGKKERKRKKKRKIPEWGVGRVRGRRANRGMKNKKK